MLSDGEYVGLIPAGAGRTGRVALEPPREGAHPRWRGADAVGIVAGVLGKGSSPLARGGHLSIAEAVGLIGLIPAGAGRTGHVQGHQQGRPAQPRWRGADVPDPWAYLAEEGSSPLARGGPGR